MGKIINIKQNTSEWLKWRSKGIGASDAPIIMGVSPWTSYFQLWCQKIGLIEREEPNAFAKAAMQRGHELEPIVREKYEKLTGYSYPSISFEHNDYPFLLCSLDGYNKDLNRNLEIKCPGKIDHAIAVNGKVPLKYIPQLQMQMLVSGTLDTHYVSWDGKSDNIVIIPVNNDLVYQETLLINLLKFWKHIETKVPPLPTFKDLKALMGYAIKDWNKVFVAEIDKDGYTKVS